MCVYCGESSNTRDHVPSKVLLDPPYPPNTPVVSACEQCNNSYSVDEPYLACLVDCVIRGGVQTCGGRARAKVVRILREKPHLAEHIERARREDLFGPRWFPDMKRVLPIVLKLARGHIAYEFAEPRLDEPSQILIAPLESLTAYQLCRFESPTEPGSVAVWPEVGSRAFLAACGADNRASSTAGWLIVQEGRYRYLALDERTVRFVLSEYLACEVVW